MLFLHTIRNRCAFMQKLFGVFIFFFELSIICLCAFFPFKIFVAPCRTISPMRLIPTLIFKNHGANELAEKKILQDLTCVSVQAVCRNYVTLEIITTANVSYKLHKYSLLSSQMKVEAPTTQCQFSCIWIL